MGVWVGPERKAYPFRLFEQASVLSDEVGKVPILVFNDLRSGATAVYERKVDGRILRFDSQSRGTVVHDRTTCSEWDLIVGEAISGPLAGTKLRQFRHVDSFWFAWVGFFPGTSVYRGGPRRW